MRKTFQLFAIFAIFIIKIQAIEVLTDNLFISEENQTYYIEYEQKYNWFQALTKCASMDMSLVTIDSQEKSDDLNTLLIDIFKSIPPLWIGALLNEIKPRQYSWISTGANLTYTNWAEGQPNFVARQEFCIQIASPEYKNSPIQWYDEKCSRPYGLICEYSRYHNLELETEEKLAESLAIQEQLQYELAKSKLFIRFLMEYRKHENQYNGHHHGGPPHGGPPHGGLSHGGPPHGGPPHGGPSHGGPPHGGPPHGGYPYDGNKTIRDIILNIN